MLPASDLASGFGAGWLEAIAVRATKANKVRNIPTSCHARLFRGAVRPRVCGRSDFAFSFRPQSRHPTLGYRNSFHQPIVPSVCASLTTSQYPSQGLFYPPVHSVEDWLINNFGERLYRRLFRTYTEKVRGFAAARFLPSGPPNAFAHYRAGRLVKTALGIEGNKRAKSLVENFQ